MSNPSGTQAVDRAARLLAEVVQSTVPVTFTELTAATGLAKSTTSRLLLALERNGLVRRDAHGRFLPGEMFVGFACRGDAGASLVAVARPFMDQLAKSTGETVSLGVARGYAVSDEELEPGLTVIAAPVFRYDAAVVAALSVSAPTSRMTPDTAAAVACRCVEAAAGLSAALGYRTARTRMTVPPAARVTMPDTANSAG